MNKNIEKFFESLINTINLILDNKFYEDKMNLENVKIMLEKWYVDYKNSNSLVHIEPDDIKIMDLDITDFFDKYIAEEPMEHNYTEILSYNFSELEKKWKNEMLDRGDKNVR